MADPVGGGIGKASQKMMQELQKQAQELAKQNQEVAKTDFSQVQQTNQVGEVQKVQEVNKTNEATKAVDVLKAAQNKAINGGDDVRLGVKTVDNAKGAEKSGFKKLLDQIVDGQNKLDDIIKLAMSGKKFDYQELLAIQASVHKFSQELELTSKVVEKATSGVKQTMQTQV
jgi:hypothetical protein